VLRKKKLLDAIIIEAIVDDFASKNIFEVIILFLFFTPQVCL
jgi:hypothetical protein